MKYDNSINQEINYLIRNKQYTKAMKVIDDYLDTTYDPYVVTSKAHIMIIDSDNNMEVLESARRLLDTVLNDTTISYPTRKYALTELGRLESFERNELGALDCYKKIIEESRYPEILIRCHMANIYTNIGMYDKALEVLDLPTFNNEAMNVRRCKVYVCQKKYKEAYDALNRPIVVDGSSRETFNDHKITNEKNFYLACIYHNLFGDLEKAREYFEKVINGNNIYDKSYWGSINGLSSIYHALHEYEKCVKYSKYYIEKGPKNSKNYILVVKNLIRSYIDVNDFKNALDVANTYNLVDYKLYIEASQKIKTFDFIGAYEILSKIETDDDSLYTEIVFKKLVAMFRLDRVAEFDKLHSELLSIISNSKFMKSEANSMKHVLYKRHNLKEDNVMDTYYNWQITEYSEEKLTSYLESKFKSRFNMDIKEIIKKAQHDIEILTPICEGFLDAYSVTIKNSGIDYSGNPIHTLKVKCIPNTKNIVIIVPNGNNMMLEETVQTEQKRISQIDKFKKRYGMV